MEPQSPRARFDDRAAGDPEAAERVRKLERLKRRLTRELPDRVRTYHARWDAAKQQVTGLEALARMVRGPLMEIPSGWSCPCRR